MRAWTLPALLTLTLVACGDKEDTGGGGGGGATDSDGDGVVAGEDCDDTDPSRYPGAEEIWYDGVDQDCDGNDNDQDGDGVSQASDCDDTDPTISPAVAEVWYDGIDQNCDGANDYDQDRDGFDAQAEAGGPDCDDTDATVFPGAVDTWYDGVDQDCDGWSDYDQDLDGFDSAADGTGDDCDDSDPLINPDAEEVWYDGIDQDCRGDDDDDQDGDGVAAVEAGGTDCVDTDPDAFPGANEQIDGVDTNCDGQDDTFSVESSYGGSYILGIDIGGHLGWDIATGTLDADAQVDLAILQRSDPSSSAAGDGMAFVFLGSSLSASPTDSRSAAATLLTTATSGPLDTVSFLNDGNSDGLSELAVASYTALGVVSDDGGGDSGGADSGAADSGDSGAADTGGAGDGLGEVGAVWIFSGAAATTSGTLDDATWSLWGNEEGAQLGFAVESLPDLDGDGLPETAVGAPGSANGDGALYLFSAATLGSSGTLSVEDADGMLLGLDGSGERVGQAVAALGDLNGDGVGDFAVGAPNGCGAADSIGDGGHIYLLSGASAATTAVAESSAWGTLIGGTSGIQAGYALTSGDLDGDGTPDLAVGAPCEDTQAGRVHMVSGVGRTASSDTLPNTAFASYAANPVFAWGGRALASGVDADGDGMDDVLIGGPGESLGGAEAGTVWLSISGAASTSLTNAAASFTGGSNGDVAGRAVALGDLDGDGLGDLLMAVPGEDSFEDEGAVYLGFSGF